MTFSCDGNKNVVGLLDDKGAVTANYTYSPFGKLISAKGADAKKCSFGFSSEYQDKESGLVYYNYRYLNPKLGRWMTRDPILEEGGFQLYCATANDAVNKWDYLGHKWSVGADAYYIGGVSASVEVDDQSKDCCNSDHKMVTNGEIYKKVTGNIDVGIGIGVKITIWNSLTTNPFKLGGVLKGPQLSVIEVEGIIKNDSCGGPEYMETSCASTGVFIGGSLGLGAGIVSASVKAGFSGTLKACLDSRLAVTVYLCGKHHLDITASVGLGNGSKEIYNGSLSMGEGCVNLGTY